MYMQGASEKSTSGSIGDQEKDNKTSGKENKNSQPYHLLISIIILLHPKIQIWPEENEAASSWMHQ